MRAPRSIIEAGKRLTEDQKKISQAAHDALYAYANQTFTEAEAQAQVDAWNAIAPIEGMRLVAPRAFLRSACAYTHPDYNK